MTIDPEDPDLPVSRRERQWLRALAERVRQRREKRAELEAARADAADVASTGPAGQRGSQGPKVERRPLRTKSSAVGRAEAAYHEGQRLIKGY